MKMLLVLALVCAVASSIKADDGTETIFKACMEETKATELDGVNFHKLQPSMTREERCLRGCFLRKSGVMDDKNKLHMDKEDEIVKILAHGNPEMEKIYETAVKHCNMIDVPADECEAAEAYNVCAAKFSIDALVEGLAAAAVSTPTPTA